MRSKIKEINRNEIGGVVGGFCFCECHNPKYGWNHVDSKKGRSPDRDYCRNVLCYDAFWDDSSCIDYKQERSGLLLAMKLIECMSLVG